MTVTKGGAGKWTGLATAQTKTAPGRAPFLHVMEGSLGLLVLAAAESGRTDQTGADLRVHKSRPRQQHIPARADRAPRGMRPVPGAV